MIFIQGKSSMDWVWVSCPAKEILDEDENSDPITKWI
jgi:hypothetical protein